MSCGCLLRVRGRAPPMYTTSIRHSGNEGLGGKFMLRILAACALVLLWAATTASGQTTYAGITGSVTDPNGAVVPHATVEATHVQTNYQYQTRSNEIGVYTLSQLREGEYTLKAK